MGYTHYWESTGRIYNEHLKEAIRYMGIVVNDNTDILAGGDGTGKPEITDDEIRFNGIGDSSHETFSISTDWKGTFNFCKTAEKPYDVIVVACLVVLKYHLGDSVSVSSDGDCEDLNAGIVLAMKYIKTNLTIQEIYDTYFDV